MHCKRKVDAGCEVYLIRSAGVLGQTATVLERMRVEADAVAPVEQSVGVLPFEGVLADGGVPTELAGPAEPAKHEAFARMVFAWELMDLDPRDERDLSDATVVLDEVCRAGDIERTRALMQRAGRVVCRNLGQVAMARELGTAFDVAAPVFCANRATLAWLRGLGAGWVYLPAELLSNDRERIAELAAEPGVLGPVDADRPELMVCEHCLLTAEASVPPMRRGRSVAATACVVGRCDIWSSVTVRVCQLPSTHAAGRGFSCRRCCVASVCYHKRVYGLPAPPFSARCYSKRRIPNAVC